jgi:hypothetical protein
MTPKIGFVFVGYDQYEELTWTADLIKNKWRQFRNSPIVAVLSGDPNKECDDKHLDAIVRVPNIVNTSLDFMREHFIAETYDISPGIGATHFNEPARIKAGNTITASMIRNYQTGFHELYRLNPDIDVVVVCESNILLLDPDGIVRVAQRMIDQKKQVAAQLVGGYADPVVKWTGKEILPQVFLVNWDFCIQSGFMFKLENTRPDCTEMMLKDNIDFHGDFDQLVMNCGNRAQWGVHLGNPNWFNFAHLDRPPGADSNGGRGWATRAEQLAMERNVMRRFGYMV